MVLSKKSKQLIADELTYVAKNVREVDGISKKLFYFSASFPMIQRVFNIEFDPELVLIHNTLQHTYNFISSRYQGIIKGEEKVIELPTGLFDILADTIQELGDAILNNSKITPALQRIARLGFVTTGNGYYLYQKNLLKLE